MATGSPGFSQQSRLFFITDKTTGMRFLIDTGAEVSVLPPSKMRGDLHPTNSSYRQSTSHTSTHYGERSMTLNLGSRNMGLRRVCRWVFIVADVPTPILGIDFLTHFGLLVDVKLIDATTT